MKTNYKKLLTFVGLLAVILVFSGTYLSIQPRAEDVQDRIEQLEERVQLLEERIVRIGYINAEQAFTVFTEAVRDQRERAREKQQEMIELRNQAIEGEITESEFRREADLLNAQILQARLEINLSMIQKMLDSEGYADIHDQLQNLKGQSGPIHDELEDTITEIREGTISPDMVTEILERINSQYEQLDQILSNIIEQKILLMTNEIGRARDFDLVLREENVVMYQDHRLVVNLTEDVMEQLRAELD